MNDITSNYYHYTNMNCYVCNTPLIWGGDHDIEEEESEHKIVTNLSCPNCDSFVLVHHGT